MQKIEVTKRIADTGAMAIVRVKTVERGFEIAQGCLDGGIDCLEISYTLPNAGEVIAAQFIIAPNLSKEVAIVCNRYQIPYAPGCTSVTEAVTGLEYGAAFIKAFPISDFYGPKMVSVFKTPIPFMPILASGGITLDNLNDYVKRGVVCCGFGGLLTKGTTEEIAANAKKIKTIIDETRAAM